MSEEAGDPRGIGPLAWAYAAGDPSRDLGTTSAPSDLNRLDTPCLALSRIRRFQVESDRDSQAGLA